MLNDFRIQNFRCFRDLHLKGLGRVNLLVGKNNTGKTTVLEALSLWAKNGDPREIGSILGHRGQLSPDLEEWPRLLRTLFLSAVPPGGGRFETQLGTGTDTLKITFGLRNQYNWLDHGVAQGPGTKWAIGYLGLDIDQPHVESIEPVFVPPRSTFPWRTRTKSLLVRAEGLDESAGSALWRQVAGRTEEDDLVAALRIIEPDVERVVQVVDPNGVPTFRLRRSGRGEPEPLESFGDGIRRVLGIALALPGVAGGLLLLDEIELGIHYEAHEPLWRWLLEVAARLDVQVFATTHSLDCVRGFTAAIGAHREQGTLYRLAHWRGDIIPFTMDEQNLITAARHEMEVR